MEKCSSDIGDLEEIKSLFGSTFVEKAIEIHYCISKGGCIPFPGVLPPEFTTDYFDVQQGSHVCRTLAAFLKAHNPHIDEVLIETQCKMDKPTPSDKFAVPDIITDQPGRTEFYEIKPVSQARKGREKIAKFEIFCQNNGMDDKYVPGIQYTPNEDRPITIQLWLGVPAKFRFRFVRTERGLILWDLCIETSSNILVEAVWKSMITRLMVALLFLAPEIASVLVLALAGIEPEAGTLVTLAGSVGDEGTNNRADVIAVQLMLSDWRVNNGMRAIGIDGIIGPETIGAIQDFQRIVTGVVDGRVDPGGPTIAALERSHLQSLVSPDTSLDVPQDFLDIFPKLTRESIEFIDGPDIVEGLVRISAKERFEQMLREYFRELRAG